MRVSVVVVVFCLVGCFEPKFRDDITCSDFSHASDCPPGYGCIQPNTIGNSTNSGLCAPAIACPTGIYCPVAMQCAAVQVVCIASSCGNGVVDPGEQCDDGNVEDGDHCSHDCSIEECGNGVLDPGEDCDPPGSMPSAGIPCSPTCKFEICGNGVVDHETEPAEQCDEGSANTDTACPTPAYANPAGMCSYCTRSCVFHMVEGPSCGDGVCNVADGEDITTCRADCSGCGNGVIDPGEQCDEGAGNTNTPCPTPPYQNPPGTCTTCTNSCTQNTQLGPYCGDGVKNGTEQCDGTSGTACPVMGQTGAKCLSGCVLDTSQCH